MDRKIIIATHGELASGFKDATSAITGATNIHSVCCFCGEIKESEDIKNKINELLQGWSGETIIFTDLLGGSVNRAISQLLRNHENLHVISGANLAVILEVVSSTVDASDLIPSAVEAGKNDIEYMNLLLSN